MASVSTSFALRSGVVHEAEVSSGVTLKIRGKRVRKISDSPTTYTA